MCNPAVIPYALAAAGAVANRVETGKREASAVRASNAKNLAEFERQNEMSGQAQANVQRTLGDYAKPEQQIEEGHNAREARINTASAEVAPYAPQARADAPKIIKDAHDREQADADGHVAQRNHMLARSGSLGDFLRARSGGVQDLNVDNGVIGDAARRSFGVAGLEARNAAYNASRRPFVTLGDVMQIAGTAYGGFAPRAAPAAAGNSFHSVPASKWGIT